MLDTIPFIRRPAAMSYARQIADERRRQAAAEKGIVCCPECGRPMPREIEIDTTHMTGAVL